MKCRVFPCVFALSSLVWCVTLFAADPAQPIFNGHDLAGWSGDPELWRVEDGQLIGSTVNHPIQANTFLVWEGGELGDFRLTFQAKIEGSNNSGAQYRSQRPDPKTWRVVGSQLDIHPKPEYVGMLYSEGTGRGIVATRGQQVVVDAESGKPKVTGRTTPATPVDISEWHEYTVIARGNRLIHKLDGQVTVDVTDNHKQGRAKGVIALQLHRGPPMTAYFKDLVLEQLAE